MSHSNPCRISAKSLNFWNSVSVIPDVSNFTIAKYRGFLLSITLNSKNSELIEIWVLIPAMPTTFLGGVARPNSALHGRGWDRCMFPPPGGLWVRRLLTPSSQHGIPTRPAVVDWWRWQPRPRPSSFGRSFVFFKPGQNTRRCWECLVCWFP